MAFAIAQGFFKGKNTRKQALSRGKGHKKRFFREGKGEISLVHS